MTGTNLQTQQDKYQKNLHLDIFKLQKIKNEKKTLKKKNQKKILRK